jgi:hypothetical protein
VILDLLGDFALQVGLQGAAAFALGVARGLDFVDLLLIVGEQPVERFVEPG